MTHITTDIITIMTCKDFTVLYNYIFELLWNHENTLIYFLWQNEKQTQNKFNSTCKLQMKIYHATSYYYDTATHSFDMVN